MPANAQDDRDEVDLSSLLGVNADHEAYGYRRIQLALDWSAHKARRLMALGDVIPLGVKRKSPYGNKEASEPLTDEKGRHNLLKERKLTAGYLHHLWAEDFTHIWFQGKWYYLATIIDLYSRLVVGWAVSDHHDTDLITAALLDALSCNKPPAICHQDQGSEYVSKRYEIIALSQGIELSFSEKGSPWENGFQESFYHYFKIEIYAKKLDRFADLGELIEAIAKQLHYYNNDRIHSELKMTPIAFSTSGIPPRNSAKHEELCAKKQNYFQQMVTGVRDRVFIILGA